MKFAVNDKVNKPKGYEYIGIVVAAFQTQSGDDRYVVESTSRGSRGMLFIFREDQLQTHRPVA